ncbi:unnamed protein product [Parascedosporium putredinis]|uniref:Peripheral subunit-binding (PSBD) domain-containing protein n=1 Tax=Parascedosporium putredinis TaxID=1442378 RepID=A0A9P1H6V9_9PEZI|nr:unnamed protein product [Parascedosporium putredinis]CAI8000809.1 unnamed protein product [Parascedosporium putredinis]
MASLASVCRLSARVVRSRVASEATFRGYQTSSRCLAAAGDVLLEIETDKATMDVEAQDDGILMKIMQGDGSKSVQVGTRIAVMAESGDDISALEIPADAKAAAPEQSKTQQDNKAEKQESQSATGRKHGIEESVVSQITPTGPGGRLLKGDVLAYLGAIKAETPAQLSSMFDKLSHLDLSNIKVAPKKEAPKAEKPAAEAPKAPQMAEVSVSISMGQVIETQQKLKGSVGSFLGLNGFISRAIDIANDELPPVAHKPTSTELFNDILGLKNAPAKATRGAYQPATSVVMPISPAAAKAASKPADIIDILSGPASNRKARPASTYTTPGLSTGTNIFSLTVPKAEEKRATVFLERVKIMLENDPGRLVINGY